MKQRQGVNGGDKILSKRSNKNGWDNKYQNQQKSDDNTNGYTNSNCGVHLIYGKWMCLCINVSRFNISHTWPLV